MTEKKPSTATIMTKLAIESGAVLFHTGEFKEYAAIPVDDHLETLPLSGGSARRWLASLYRQATGDVPGSQSIQDALVTLQGHAVYEGAAEDVHVRVAEHDGDIFIDLGDSTWGAIRVNASGWEQVDTPPVYFRRPRGLTALPAPVAGSVGALDGLVNIGDEIDFRLLMTVAASYLFPTGPYVVLVLLGEQGSAKSFTARIIRDLIDPSAAPLRSLPRDERDLMIAATNGWIVNLDNVSYLRQWLSDALCRLSSGSGFATRALYTDGDEAIFAAARPVILNGISSFVTRGDLADRALTLTLPYVPPHRRRDDEEVLSDLHRARPMILGGILDLVVEAMRNGDQRPKQLPRMATFARRGYALAPALGWSGPDFMKAYASKTKEMTGDVLEDSIIGPLIVRIAENSWAGRPSELLTVLGEMVSDKTKESKRWPKAANSLSGELRRLIPALRAEGVEVGFSKTPGSRSHRLVTIRRVVDEIDATDATDAPVSESVDPGVDGDDPGIPSTYPPRYEGVDSDDGVDGLRGSSNGDVPGQPGLPGIDRREQAHP